jgi:hypothetical protein
MDADIGRHFNSYRYLKSIRFYTINLSALPKSAFEPVELTSTHG